MIQESVSDDEKGQEEGRAYRGYACPDEPE